MLEEKAIITHINPKSPISEAYRVLRTNIQYSSVDKPLKTIVITSAGPMEGKSTTIANLAVTFAQAGRRTLLIDADLRKPMIHRVFQILNYHGLTNLIATQDELNSYIRRDIVENLDIITSGTIPPNPSEILNSKTMKNFMERIKSNYDIVLIDSPPVGSVTDASVISTYVDGTILIVKSGKAEINAVKRAKETLERVNANIIGVVLNHFEKKNFGNDYYYQYYYSDKTLGKKRKKQGK